MNAQVVVHQWLSLKPEVKERVRVIFNVGKSGHTEVVTDHLGNAKVMSDGTTQQDLLAISREKMEEYLAIPSSQDNFYTIFENVILKIEKELNHEEAKQEEPKQEAQIPAEAPEEVEKQEAKEPEKEPEVKEQRQEEATEERKIKCDLCGKELKSKDQKYDDRVLKLHKGKWHK